MSKPVDQPRSSALMNSQLLQVKDLHVQYFTQRGAVKAVDGVSFEVSQGEVFGLAGESGCGKSTIAHAILRILHSPAVITGGEIHFESQDILGMNQTELEHFRWQSISLVTQSAMNALNPVENVASQITDVLEVHAKMPRLDRNQRAAELFTMVGLDPSRLKDYPHQLSGGMRQRVVIAMALALNPKMIIMDEPTTALDVIVQKQIMQKIEDLQSGLGFSTMFITHDLSLLVEQSTRIAIMYAGEIVETAPSRELFAQPYHFYTQGLMNSFPSLTGPKNNLTGIPGAPPDLVNPPSGCRFHLRCPAAQERCIVEKPAWREISAGHFAACHLA